MIIELDIVPPRRTHQSSLMIMKNKVTGKPFIGKTSKDPLREWGEEFIRAITPHRPVQPLQQALSVSYKLIYPYRKGEKKKDTRRGDLIWKHTRPDGDNSIKYMTDILTKQRFWEDDSLITDLRVRKYWGPIPGMIIEWHALSRIVAPF